MSLYGVSKFLFEFNKDDTVRAAFKADADASLARYPLTEPERQAIASFDFRALHTMGVHPLLLTALANGSGIPILTYFESLRTGEPVPKDKVGTAVRG